MYDPTYTGKTRKELEPISSDQTAISFFSPPNLTGKPHKTEGNTPFQDRHGIGYSRFDQKGSVLFANIDAVLNLTGHVGGYFATSTQNDNMHFYSLFFEDRNLELYSYLQWRLPYSITRLVSSKSVGRPDLESINLDLIEYDIPAVLEGRPVDGYRLMGVISHHTLSLRVLTTMAMIMFSSLSSIDGKGFIVIPYGADKRRQGRLSLESLIDFMTLLSTLFTQVWLFRPYMCYEFLCIGIGSPKPYPEKCSAEETQILSIWTMLDINTEGQTTSPTKAIKDFNRIFEAIDENSHITKKVTEIVQAKEPGGRDRVEVLSRWQIPDQLRVKIYPRFKNLPMIHVKHKQPIKQLRKKSKPRLNTP